MLYRHNVNINLIFFKIFIKFIHIYNDTYRQYRKVGVAYSADLPPRPIELNERTVAKRATGMVGLVSRVSKISRTYERTHMWPMV